MTYASQQITGFRMRILEMQIYFRCSFFLSLNSLLNCSKLRGLIYCGLFMRAFGSSKFFDHHGNPACLTILEKESDTFCFTFHILIFLSSVIDKRRYAK